MEAAIGSSYLDDDGAEGLLSRAAARLKDVASSRDASILLSTTKGSRGMANSFGRFTHDMIPKPYIVLKGNIARTDPVRVMSDSDRQMAGHVRSVEDPVTLKHKSLKSKNAASGVEWFNMPKTVLTPELKRDLQLLKMRSVLDPKRHYKKEDSKSSVPKFSQVGRIIEGPTDFYSSRLQNKDRKQTLIEEVMRGENSTGRFKSTYDRIQVAKSSGKRAHYKSLKAKRIRGIKR